MDSGKIITDIVHEADAIASELGRLKERASRIGDQAWSLRSQQLTKTLSKPTPLNDIAGAVYAEACTKGWWDNNREFPEVIALCHSELSEALEEYRAGHKPLEVYYREDGKPEGIAVEMIDTVIRILDWLGSEEANIDGLLAEKILFNMSRPARHGGKVA